MVPNVKPQARESGLVIEELDDELLVYDLQHHKAHCLNSTAALVWKHCDGKTGVGGIATRLRKETQIPIDDEVVWVALRRLGKANLLSERVAQPKGLAFGSTRRDLLKKLALVGGLSVVTIIAPTAAEAATGCTVGVSCQHACISNHSAKFPCPGGVPDQQKGKCCNSNKICVQTQSTGTNNSGSCSGATCCHT